MALRTNLSGKAQIILDDRTSHGGIIITGSSTNAWHGRPIARKGDKVYCPKCKPNFLEIAEGLGDCTDTDARLPMATEGHKTTCGAILIAASAPSSLLGEAVHFTNGTGFDDRYILRDANGHPMPNTYYGSKKPDSEIEYGTTDEAGCTRMHLTGEEAKKVTFYIAG